ncbi:MAG: OmpA family protein [Bacteroidota bacterium]|nr:OmpA family protein [Bacteroidota bacterium]
MVAYAQSAAAKSDSASTFSSLGISIDELMADADKSPYIRYGIVGGVTWNTHLANFAEFGFPTDAINFGQKSRLSFMVGALAEYPLADRFGIALRASYTHIGDTLIAPERLLVGGINPSVATIRRVFTFPNVAIAAAEPCIKYHPIDGLTLYAGARIGTALNRRFTFDERIGGEYRFIDSATRALDTVRNRQTGNFPFAPVLISAMGGLSYEIPLEPSGRWLLAVEGFYTHGLNQLSADTLVSRVPMLTYMGRNRNDEVPRELEGTDRDPMSLAWQREVGRGSWFMNNIRGGVALRYSPFRTIRPELSPAMQETFKQIKKIDSAIAVERAQNQKRLAQVDSINKAIAQRVEELKKVGISVNITKVVGIDERGKELPGKPKLVVEQFRKTVTQPLLPAIFFDEGSFAIPSRYRRVRAAERGSFKISDLVNKSNYEVYRHILNIIGKRMEEYPSTVLIVTGCNANVGQEQGNQKLSEQRAQAVSDYLQDVWKIQAKRIIIQKRDLPENPSNSATAAGAAENRRVDLSSPSPELLAPLVSDVVAKVPTPPTIRFGLEINAGAGLKQWNFEATQFQDNEIVTVFQRTGTTTYPQQLDWELAKDASTVPASGQDVTVQLSITDVNNKSGDAPLISIPVEQINIQKKELEGKDDIRIDAYDIIGFTGGLTPALDETNSRTLETIRAKLKPGSTITITAYTDTVGDVEYNKQIAQKRAAFVANAIGATRARINAVGPTTLHDNTTPEGRMYNRFVRVEVFSPTR